MMKEQHLSDSDIQQFALEGMPLNASQAAHLEQCRLCSGNVALYRQMARGLAAEPTPAFDFPISAAVLRKLPARQAKRWPSILIALCAAIPGILVCVAVPLSLLSSLPNLSAMDHGGFTIGVSSFALLFAVLSAMLYIEHARKIKQLNFPPMLQHGRIQPV